MSPDAGSGTLAGLRRAGRPSLLVGAGIALVVFVLLSWLLVRDHETRSEAVHRITVRGNTLLIPDQAPQWRYVELSTAMEAAPLPPPAVPGRVSFDEKRTASLSAPSPGEWSGSWSALATASRRATGCSTCAPLPGPTSSGRWPRRARTSR